MRRDLVAQLFAVQGDQIGVAVALRVELPPRGEQAADLCLTESALRGRQSGELNVLVADPPEPAQDRQRLGVLGLIPVVEAEHDRFACPQRHAPAPVGLDLIKRDRMPAGVLQCLHLGGELAWWHIQAREGRSRWRRRDHVIHEDRDRLGPGVAGRCARASGFRRAAFCSPGKGGGRSRARLLSGGLGFTARKTRHDDHRHGSDRHGEQADGLATTPKRPSARLTTGVPTLDVHLACGRGGHHATCAHFSEHRDRASLHERLLSAGA